MKANTFVDWLLKTVVTINYKRYNFSPNND